MWVKNLFQPQVDLWVGTITFGCLIVYVALYGIFAVGGFTFEEFDPKYLAVLIPVWVIDGFRTSFEAVLRTTYHDAKEDLSKVTVIIATLNGEAVLPATLTSLTKRIGPRRIIVSSNGSTDRTCSIAKEYGAVCLNFKSPLGKVRAINAALQHVRTPYVLLLDDDTLLENAVVPTSLLDQGYDAVAFRVRVKKRTWVSYFQMHEYRKGDISKRQHNKRASVQNISGAIGLFKLSELQRQINLHSGEFSGEDLQRTLLIHLCADSRGVVLANSEVITEAPATWWQLFKQRSFGWWPGLYANFFNYLRIMCRRRTSMALRFDAFYNCFFVIGLDIIRILALPIMIFYPWYFAVTYGIYVALETIPYLKNGRKEPFWVIALYPLFGIFSLITRAVAFAVFLYRRLVVRIGKHEFRDDYRHAHSAIKWASLTATIVLISSALTLNIVFRYSSFFTNPHLSFTLPSFFSL